MKKIISLITVFCLAVCLCGCSKTPKKLTDYSFDYFDTVTTIIGFETNGETFRQNCQQIKNWLSKYHKLYDIYTVYDNVNNLCKINMSYDEAITVEPEIIELLEYSKKLYKETNQKLNIAMGSVLSVWHESREYGLKNPEKATLPDLEILKAKNKHTDIESVIIDKENSTVKIIDKNTKLDVGGIAKGYAAQKVAEKMESLGLSGYILNIGGNVKIIGTRPDSGKWKVGIENPNTEDQENPYIEMLELDGNMSLVTSGSYQRFYTVNGKNYHHIIDPATLLPADNFKSVSVLCEDSGRADAYSTALFCMSLQKGKKLIANSSDIYVMWILQNGEKVYSDGFEKFITE